MSDSEQPPQDAPQDPTVPGTAPGPATDAGPDREPGHAPGTGPAAAAPGAEEMLALTEELGATPRRARRGTARRRGRFIGPHGEVVVDAEAASATVRSETAEAGAGSGPPREDVPEPDLLDGDGRPIADPTAVPAPGAPAAGTPEPGVPSDAPRAHHVVEPAVFLAMAVRSYLEGLDRHGHEHPVTEDRLARLRETLAVHDGDAPA